jgi:uroporphyrinogen decarboxylase
MTGKERFLTALNQEIPDRVPIFELGFNEGSVINLGKNFSDNLPPATPLSEWTQEDINTFLDLLAVIIERTGNDAVATFFLFDMEPVGDKLVKDRFGTIYRTSEWGEPIPVDGPVKDPEDIKKVISIKPDSEELVMLGAMKSRLGVAVAYSVTVRDPFSCSWCLTGGMEKVLLEFMRRPEFALDLARVSTEFIIACIEMAVNQGADFILMEGDLAFNPGPLMAPDQYRRFVKPFHAEIVDFSHRSNCKIIKHTDGNFEPILDDLIEVGFDGIHPFQPQCMDIVAAKNRMQGKAAVLGNIDCTELLPFGSEEEVINTVKNTIQAVAPGGGYIITSSNSIHPGVNPDNYIAMAKAAKEYGAYPINI